jgi:hypothetical protein
MRGRKTTHLYAKCDMNENKMQKIVYVTSVEIAVMTIRKSQLVLKDNPRLGKSTIIC